MDYGPFVWDHLWRWRAANPTATVCNLAGRGDIRDDDLKHLVGIRVLNLSNNPHITGAGFVHLKGTIVDLNIQWCNQVTDEAFVHLKGTIRKLHIDGIGQITDAAFPNLEGTIQTLTMRHLGRVTNAAFPYLRGIHTLAMDECTRVTDAAFVNLAGIKRLGMLHCNQITPMALVPLYGVEYLLWNNFDVYNSALRAALHLRNLDAYMNIVVEHPDAVELQDPAFVQAFRAAFTDDEIRAAYQRALVAVGERARNRRGPAMLALVAAARARYRPPPGGSRSKGSRSKGSRSKRRKTLRNRRNY
jgi:hypothetical protein